MGNFCHVADSANAHEHTRKEMGLDFYMAKPTPMTPEITESIEFIKNAPLETAKNFCAEQLARTRNIADDAAFTKIQCESPAPEGRLGKSRPFARLLWPP